MADGPCLYHAAVADREKTVNSDRLDDPSIAADETTLTVRGKLLGLDVEQRFTAPADRPMLEERIVLKNSTAGTIALAEFEAGMQRRVADKAGNILPEFAADRLLAVPFLAGRTIRRAGGRIIRSRRW